MRSYAFSALAAFGAVLALYEPSLAQSSLAGSASPDSSSETLEEIQVFAQKRTESVQSVPISVTTVSPTDIANWRINDSTDLQNVTPNMTIGSVYQGTVPQITLRGVGVNDGIETTSPSVGTYIDQMYMASSAAAVMQVFDMGRVEILRGPQGTLYGKNTNGGAINFYTQRPTQDFQAEMALEGGNYSERSGSAFVSGPLFGPTLTGRLSVYFKDRDGYGEVLAPGPVEYSPSDVWAEHSYGIRAQLLYKPNDDMEWLFLGSNGRNRITYGWPVIGLRDPANPGVDCAKPLSGTCVDALGERLYSPTRPYSTIQNRLSSTTPETTIATVQGTWNLNSIALTSISGYIHTHTRLIDDGASDYVGPGDLFYFDQNKHSDQLSQEFRVASTGVQAFNWTTGLYYSSSTLSQPVSYEFSLSPGTTDGRRTTTDYAAFAQADYAITSKWKVTTGLRYSYNDLATKSVNLGGNVTEASHHWDSVPLSPTNTFSGQAEYSVTLGSLGTIAPRVNYSYRSAQAFTPEGLDNPRGMQSGYGLLGAGLKYDSPDHFEIDVWGRNLTNKVYLLDVQPSDSFNGSDFPTYGMPRMYGVTLRKKF